MGRLTSILNTTKGKKLNGATYVQFRYHQGLRCHVLFYSKRYERSLFDHFIIEFLSGAYLLTQQAGPDKMPPRSEQ